MIRLKTLDEALEKIKEAHLTPTVLLDVVTQLTIVETEFKDYQPNLNEVVILDTDETFDTLNLVPEIDEDIDNYNKKLYILSDSGEGIVIYRKIKENDND